MTIARACLCAGTIVGGLGLRALGLRVGLPAFIVKYGGSALWGAMVFSLVALAASRLSRRSIAQPRLPWRRTVSADSHARARRLSADTGWRALARPQLLSLRHGGLWRGDHSGDGARSFHSPAVSQQRARQLSIKSLTRLFARGGLSAFIA
jgi:hypothetical protein